MKNYMTDTSPMRSRDEVIGRVLEAAREGSSRINIMYKSFVSFDKLQELLDRLITDGLLEQEKGELGYRTTQKGLDFMNKLNCSDANNNETCRNSDTDQGQSFTAGSNFDTLNLDKVLVIGLGQLGLPVAKYIKERGFDVYGYDISTTALERAEKIAGIKKAINFSGFDVYIICVSTHKQEDIFSPQIEGLLSIVQNKISKEAKNGALVAIESTIPKGTSRKIFEMLNHRLHVAHAPHRWYALEEKEHGVNQLRVVGGVCDCCLRVAMQFYDGADILSESESESESEELTTTATTTTTMAKESITTTTTTTPTTTARTTTTEITSADDDGRSSSSNGSGCSGSSRPTNNVNDNISSSSSSSNSSNTDYTNIRSTKKASLGIPMHPVSDIEIAELTKIIENAHRYLQIAFAEDLYLYCQANNINFAELRDSLNTKWNVNILEPREGIGGHCLPKDTTMFLNSSKSIKSKIIQAAIQVDAEYRMYRENRALRVPRVG
jgi:UDP-N-acetyl-D-mannosaminuronate dehydrogenase/predicted transcriptional regulator